MRFALSEPAKPLGGGSFGGSAHKCWDLLDVSPDPTDEGCHNATGGTFGGQIGYRAQTANWVYGIEAQGNWADFTGRNTNINAALGAPFSPIDDHSKMDAFGLFTGQIGYAWNNVLFYAKGGAAVVADKYSWVVNAIGPTIVPIPLSPGTVVATASETRWGATAGVGLEFGFAPGWSVGLEYDHLFMGVTNSTLNILPPLGPATATQRISQDVDIGLVRVNYTFGGPVVARY